MKTFSALSGTSYQLPLSDADQAALRSALLHDLGAMPFGPDEPISRTLWVVFVGAWGARTQAVLPVDDRLDVPDSKYIAGLCDLAGKLASPDRCHSDENPMIVLRRPGPAEIRMADRAIFRLVRQGLADRDAAPWTCYVAGPDGVRRVERAAQQC